MSGSLVTTEIENGIAVLTLCRPEKRNALSVEVLTQFSAALDQISQGGARAL